LQPTVLLIDNSRALLRLLRQRLGDELGLAVETAASLEELRGLLATAPDITLAVSNLRLTGGADGEAIELLLRRGAPVVVLTGALDEAARRQIAGWPIVDYIVKEGPGDIEQIVAVLRRIRAAVNQPVLVVDDSPTMRRHLGDLLRRLGHPVMESPDGPHALELVTAHPELRLVITDFQMPSMDGAQLTRSIRQIRRAEELAVVGISAASDGHVTARLLKAGADDFLAKPFEAEAFAARVARTLAFQTLLREAGLAVRADPVTGLLNRRTFLAGVGDRGALGWVEIDGWDPMILKHGDDAGDVLGKALAGRMRDRLGDCCLGRIRDGAFAVWSSHLDERSLADRLHELSGDVSALMVGFGRHVLPLRLRTATCGSTGRAADRLCELASVVVGQAQAAR
jgi:CheY-like chemotaxis protein